MQNLAHAECRKFARVTHSRLFKAGHLIIWSAEVIMLGVMLATGEEMAKQDSIIFLWKNYHILLSILHTFLHCKWCWNISCMLYMDKGFKMAFMMNKHAMNNSCEIILEKLKQLFWPKIIGKFRCALYLYAHYTRYNTVNDEENRVWTWNYKWHEFELNFEPSYPSFTSYWQRKESFGSKKICQYFVTKICKFCKKICSYFSKQISANLDSKFALTFGNKMRWFDSKNALIFGNKIGLVVAKNLRGSL